MADALGLRLAHLAQREGEGTEEVVALKLLRGAARGSTARERHGLRTARQLVYAECVQVQRQRCHSRAGGSGDRGVGSGGSQCIGWLHVVAGFSCQGTGMRWRRRGATAPDTLSGRRLRWWCSSLLPTHVSSDAAPPIRQPLRAPLPPADPLGAHHAQHQRAHALRHCAGRVHARAELTGSWWGSCSSAFRGGAGSVLSGTWGIAEAGPAEDLWARLCAFQPLKPR